MLVDPRTLYPQPPFKPQPQEFPGSSAKLVPQPDHGEQSYTGSGRLSGRRALVTGGDSGIGRAVAIAYAREGADVALSYLPEEEDDAQTTARWVRDAGRQVLLLPGDVRDDGYCRKAVDAVVEGFGGLDLLVNNAGFGRSRKTLDDIPDEEWQRAFDTSVHGLFHMTRAAVAVMDPGSAIVNTSSVAAKAPSPLFMPYAASKAAVANITIGLAQMYADRGIRVNAVLPGTIYTPFIVTVMDEEDQKMCDVSPLGRPGQPAEVASAYVMLAASESSFTTGSLVTVSGGLPIF